LTNASIFAISTNDDSSNVIYSPVEKSMHLKTLIATVLLALSLLLPYAVGA